MLGAFARISTVLLALVITVLGWFAHGPAIASAPASAPHLIYTYAASHGSVPIVGCPSERSPPGTGQFDTTHAGVDFMSDGACARSESTSTPDHPTTYDSSAAPVQITRATDTTQTVARGNAATFLALASSMVAANAGTRLAQDVAVSPIAPNALGFGRSIGRASHNQALQADIAALPRGATGIRVNQQQVNGLGQRMGINRPDLQYSLNGQRYYVEYEGLANPRGALHEARILANDPGSNFILRLVP